MVTKVKHLVLVEDANKQLRKTYGFKLALKPNKGSTKNKKRRGRGEGSGLGVTAGRGHKGYGSRGGAKKRAWFEGGQMPLQRRLPKFGFTNINKVAFQVVNVAYLRKLIGKENY